MVLFAAALAASVRAEKVFSTREQLLTQATHVLTGTVESVTATRELEGAWEYVRYHALVRVGALEKGEGFAAGDSIGCRYWSKGWMAWTSPPPGTNGHSPLPRRGQSVRVYVVDKGYNGFGETTDGGYDVLGRNGWEILSPPLATGVDEPYYDALDSDWRRQIAWVLGAIAFAVFVLVWFLRTRKRKHV